MIVIPSSTFADNLDRLLGVHRLSAREASQLLDVSAVALSEWRNAKREPGLTALLRLSALFEVPGDALMTVPFAELLGGPVGDVDRFERVEEKIAKAQRPLKAVKPGEVPDFPWLVTPDEMAAQRKRGSQRKARR
ncbi:MAG: helix-turn-helix transcriptional regulator [Actinomycetota bacterium]|nr:helix-turn-helix transcriptional regulator [Actinomycetota bacterium]